MRMHSSAVIKILYSNYDHIYACMLKLRVNELQWLVEPNLNVVQELIIDLAGTMRRFDLH
jgi:hypothetical protein